jgi:F-type H+-transporting ATPase subunit a
MLALISLLLALQLPQAQAQAPEVPPPPTVPADAPLAEQPPSGGDIMQGVLDERKVKAPWGYVQLPPARSWMVGPIDMTPTKYVVYLWITGLLTLLLILPAAQSAKRSRREARAATGGHNAIEALVLFFRQEVVMKNIGHGGEKFAPFVITIFFFIVVANLMGLVPYGGSITASISVTATLALMSFVAIEFAGMQALGFKGYMGTIFYWNRELPLPLRVIMLVILSPVELLGKLAKPFALAVRLMANMSAGKILIYALIGLIFIFGSWWVVAGPVIMTVAITFLKIFVAFLQAFIFALLTSVFIGMIRHAH